MANSFYTRNDRVVHELFRTIERYDMRRLLKAASDSSLSVISEEEVQQLQDEHQNQKMALCEGLKKLMVKDNGRLKKFAQFILAYNEHVQKTALATIQLLDGNQWSLWNSQNAAPECSGSLLSGPMRSLIQQRHRSSSSSGSNTPPSPMDVDSKDVDISSSSLAQEASNSDPADDGGYITATYTCTNTGPSSEVTRQLEMCSEHLFKRPPKAGSTPPLQMVQKTKGQPTESDTYTYEERLSQPTVEEYQIADAWPPMQEHGYAYYSDCLAQDVYPLESQPGDDVKKNIGARPTSSDGWPRQLKENYKDILQNLNLNALLPHLVQNHLLTQKECQEIDRDKDVPLRQNHYFLLYVLPQKGRDAFNVFMKCLKAEKEHLGHQDLVKILCNKKK